VPPNIDLGPADYQWMEASMRRSGTTKEHLLGDESLSQPSAAAQNGVLPDAKQRRPIKILSAAIILAVIIMAVNFGIFFWVHDPNLRSVFSDILSPVLDLLACIVLFFAAKSSAVRSRRHAIAWGTIALGTLFYSLGGFVWFILEIGLKEPPFPSIGDGFYLAYYLIFLVGAFLLLEKPDTTGMLISRALDMSIIMGSAILGFWNLLIGPMVSSNVGLPLMEQTILMAYPAADLVLLGALLLILYNPSKKQAALPIFLLAGSLLAVIITDSIYTYQTLLGTYVSGGILDHGWVAGSLLAALAGVSQWAENRSNNLPINSASRNLFLDNLGKFQPYVWLGALFFILVTGEMGLTPLPMGVLRFTLGVGAILLLVLIRQFITLTENNRLNTRLQKTMEKIQLQTAELEKANRELQIDISERKSAEAARKQSEDLFQALFELSPDAIVLIDPHATGLAWPIVDCNAAACRMNGYTREEMVGQNIDLINATQGSLESRLEYFKNVREAGIYRFVAEHRRKDGAIYFADVSTMLLSVGGRELLVGIDHDITERRKAEEEIRHRLEELEAINKVSSALRAAQTLEEMLPILLEQTLEVMQTDQGSIWLYDPGKDELTAAIARGYGESDARTRLAPVKPGQGIAGRVFADGKPFIFGNSQLDANPSQAMRELVMPGVGGAAVPIRTLNDVIGTFIVNVALPRELTPGEIHLLTTLSEIAGNAIRRTSLHQETDRRLRQLTALSEIDRAISSSVDLRLNLTMLLKQVTSQLGVHAAGVLLFNPASQMLEPVAASGFRTRLHEQTYQRLGEGFAGHAALDRQILHISNLAERGDNPLAVKARADESFVSYFAVPLIAKGQIKGVLEIFHRAPLQVDAEWLDFLNTLAGQAAIAIENVLLFENLQRSNFELSMAYDATIEGWSRALDLRDKETEGHTQRVTDITVRLARTFGLDENELSQVRWGALLHDIGKMGIPDGILLKPGPLTEEEWAIMRKHPVFAYEMLLPIQYLRFALDIPYHHHEKWDGSGYPSGLKGEQIPLAARIFAVVDVWDALRSDRPYRAAWPAEKVLEHIRASAGTHFDPQVVKRFLEMESAENPKPIGTKG
jgi:PAS domain S-box-containing protein